MSVLSNATIKAPRLHELQKAGNMKHIALLVAQVMYLNAEQTADGRFYRASVARAVRQVWGNQMLTEPERKAVTRLLLKRGFSSSSSGWRVPDNALEEWDLDEEGGHQTARVRHEVAVQAAKSEELAGEVVTSFTCTVSGCGSHGQKMTLEERNEHYRRHHRGLHRTPETARQTPAERLLEALMRSEGYHPRDYAKRLNLSPSTIAAASKELQDAGLIYTTGAARATRYHLGDAPKSQPRKAAPPKPVPPPKPASPPVAVQPTNEQVFETVNGLFVLREGVLYKLVPVE